MADWDVSGATFWNSQVLLVSGWYPAYLFMSDDGLHCLVWGGASYGHFRVLTLSTAYDITTATYTSDSPNISGTYGNASAISGSPDGRYVYMGANDSTVKWFEMTTPWDASTMTFRGSLDLSSTTTSPPLGVSIDASGTHLYFFDINSDQIERWDLATAWGVTTGAFVTGQVFTPGLTNLQDIFVSSDGLHLMANDVTNDRVRRYDMSTAWDLTTLAFHSQFSYTAKSTNAAGLTFSQSGDLMYLRNAGDYSVLAYDINYTPTPTGPPLGPTTGYIGPGVQM